MSKRSRRERRPNLMPEAFGTPQAAAAAAANNGAAGAPAAKSSAPSTPAKVLDWRTEYREVVGELKVTFFSAIALVAVMIVLSFIIR